MDLNQQTISDYCVKIMLRVKKKSSFIPLSISCMQLKSYKIKLVKWVSNLNGYVHVFRINNEIQSF